MLDRFLDWLAASPPAVVYVVVVLLSFLENVFPPVPADLAMALGAFVLQGGGRSAVELGACAWLANSVSAAGMYALARRHREFFRRGWPRHLLTPEAMAALERAYDRYGAMGIFASRFVPTVRAAVTPFAGVAGLPAARTLVPALTASALWYALLVLAGTTLGREWQRVRAVVETGSGVLGALGLLASVAVVVWLWRRRRPNP